MGTVYEIATLRGEAVQRLQLSFPSILASFDSAMMRKPPTMLITPYKGYLIDLINLAHEHAVHSVLPALSYLGAKNLQSVLYGLERADGSVARIAPDLLPSLVAGRAAFLKAQAMHSFTWLFDTHDDVPECLENYCADSRRAVLRRVMAAAPDKLMGLSQWVKPPVPLCEECTSRAKWVYNGDRLKMWERLPILFGMAPWNVLRRGD
jgi:hypothetical protein